MHNEAVVSVIGKEMVLEYWSQGNQLQFYLEKTLTIVQCNPQLGGRHPYIGYHNIMFLDWNRNREVRNISRIGIVSVLDRTNMCQK